MPNFQSAEMLPCASLRSRSTIASRSETSRALGLCERSQPFLAHCSKFMLVSNDEDARLRQDVLQKVIAGAFAPVELFQSENLWVDLSADLLGHAGEQLTQLTQGDFADDEKIDVAVCLLARLGERPKNKCDLDSFFFTQCIPQQVSQSTRLEN